MVKRAQYKIQQMAFMILAIFFFFILVGLFFIGYMYTGMQKDFAVLQEEKALAALKVVADSTELNCEQSEDWCIDKDKLIAFSENSDLYQNFWSVASIELLMVYPPRGESVVESVPIEPARGAIDCSGGYGDHNGDGFSDQPINSILATYSFVATQGFMGHLPPDGDALRPKLILENLNDGERVQISDLSGSIHYVGTDISCSKSALSSGYGWVMGGFYSGDDELISERALVEFVGGDGVLVPEGARKFYVYVKESDEFSDSYSDNTGGCSFSVKKLGWESCYVEDSSSSSELVVSAGEPVLCPAPYCDYYILYDSGQKDKMTFSAYVNVCETIDRSHEICELAKLMLGVKIPEVEEE